VALLAGWRDTVGRNGLVVALMVHVHIESGNAISCRGGNRSGGELRDGVVRSGGGRRTSLVKCTESVEQMAGMIGAVVCWETAGVLVGGAVNPI